MVKWTVFFVFLMALATAFQIWRSNKIRQISIDRLRPGFKGRSNRIKKKAAGWVKGYPWVPLIPGAAAVLFLFFIMKIPVIYAFSFGIIAALLSWQINMMWAAKRLGAAEDQLADSIDLLISALRAGASAEGAVDSVIREVKEPIRTEFSEILGRLRLGDNPAEVFGDLGDRIPVESFKLFSTSMSVHWGTGGRLVPLLATVAKTIRDRIEISRQIRLQTTETRVSTIAMILLAYFIAAVVWRSEPERTVRFATSLVGNYAIAAAMIMQAVGIVWISKLSALKY